MIEEREDSRLSRFPSRDSGSLFAALALCAASLAHAGQEVAIERGDLLAAARQVIAADPVAALVTVDADGYARIRSVEVRPPDAGDGDFVIWLATQPRTRKLRQIEADPRVALYFESDDDGAYLSISGVATVHRDVATSRRMTWRSAEARAQFWPDFPEDYVLIRIEPLWLEVLGFGVEADEETWRPQRVQFGEPDGRGEAGQERFEEQAGDCADGILNREEPCRFPSARSARQVFSGSRPRPNRVQGELPDQARYEAAARESLSWFRSILLEGRSSRAETRDLSAPTTRSGRGPSGWP